MSDPEMPPSTQTSPAPRRNGWMTAFMIIVGVILLLPGVCALGFGAVTIFNPSAADTTGPFVLVGLLVGFGGVMLIRAAIRRVRR